MFEALGNQFHRKGSEPMIRSSEFDIATLSMALRVNQLCCLYIPGFRYCTFKVIEPNFDKISVNLRENNVTFMFT